MEGVLTFAEYINDINGPWDSASVWNAARQGMIPAANAVEMPDEEYWPDWAKCIVCEFSSEDGVTHGCDPALIIPRSKPVWKPCEGDKVVYWFDGRTAVYFGKYGNLDEVFRNEPHYAKLESLDDIGHDISWFKTNRSWI